MHKPERNRIRFVFHDSIVAQELPFNATYGDVARSWAEVASQHYSNPLAVDVRMTRPRRPHARMHAAAMASG